MNISVGMNSMVPNQHCGFLPLRCLQRSIDDKFHCLEEREGQVRRLQLALREKERDLERLRCILSNNEETITVCSSCRVQTYQTCLFILGERDFAPIIWSEIHQ